MSIWERLSAATHNLSLGGQISSLLGFGPTSQERKRQVCPWLSRPRRTLATYIIAKVKAGESDPQTL
jgi:hypothetical protein